jgi:zinc protease
MKKFRSFLLPLVTFFISLQSNSQTDLSAPVQIDPEIRTGKLDNGLTYFIRHNKEPENRASFYFIQNTGALLENDDQNGLAHFLEHMALNGTKNFPGKGIISSLEKHGLAFGPNINAFTAFDETVYLLSDVPMERKDLIDTCLLILHDWSDFISLEDKEIDLERDVILEEWRTYKDASTRILFDKVIPVVLKGSKYAERDIIGKPEIIKNFSYETLRQFYRDWYRTDLQAVAVVGDLDVNEVEKKIKELFSALKPVENAKPRPVFEVPDHSDTRFVLATDREAPQTTVSVISLHKAVPGDKRNLQYLRDSYMISLMNSMINTRVSELLQKGNPPFVSGSISMGSYLAREYDAFTISANARMNEEPLALEAIYTEAERARRFGFNNAELDRAKARMLTNFENTFKQKDKISNDTYAEWIQNYFLTGEPLTSADFDFEFLKKVIGGISSNEISAKFSELMTDQNRSIIVQGPEGNDIRHLSEQEALDIISRVRNSQLTAYEDKVLSESLVNEDLKGSPIIKTVPLPQFNAVEWTLGNNAKVVYRKADYEKDNVILSSFSFGGSSLYENEFVPSAEMLPSVIGMYGIGDYDNITLQKMLAGKKAAASVSLGQLTEGINGSSTPKDFETMMQLLYLRFSKPRFDPDAHNAIMQRYEAFLANMAKDPSKIIQDSISLFLTNFNPRTFILNNEELKKVNFDKVETIYNERFSNAGDFTFFIVGNIDEGTVRPLVEKYIGSLKGTADKETFIDRNIRPPKGKFNRDVRIPLTIPKSTVFVNYSSEFKYTPYNNLCLKVISGILDLVYTEKVREEAGGTYSVSVGLSSALFPYQNASGMVMFDCDPEKAAGLKQIVYDEINTIVRSGPSKMNLEKVVSNMLKNREESKLHNNYWSNTLYSYYYTGINSNDPANFENILQKLTVKDIKKVAKAFFSKADVADIVFRPETE